MTIEEIIKRLLYKAENIKAHLEPGYFSECAEYLEKYCWHDLRKDPDDLPDDHRNVYACFEFNGIKQYMEAYCFHDFQGNAHWAGLYGVKATAWKYLERFEEEGKL